MADDAVTARPVSAGADSSGEDCPSDDELAAFLDGTASDAVRERLEAHFDGCASCREAVGHVAAAASEPRTIDRYKLEAQLGAGGMGVVWRAWDPALERPLAIKLMHPELHDDEGRDRAIREARALARLQHPNVVAIYDVGEHEGDLFIATELVDGQSMDKWQRGKSPREIVAAYAQAGRGLAAAHALGLVHRDVKPSNILVSRDGRVRIGDFGLATNAAHSSVARAPSPASPSPSGPLPQITEAGALLGTPAYMAPEQRTTANVDARADQYSLCLALAEALLGKQPPFDPTVAQLAASGVDAPWPAIARGLRDHARDRFPHIEELVAALEPTSAPKRTTVPLVLAGVAVAGVAGGALWFAMRDEPARTPVSTPVVAPPVAPEAPWHWKTEISGPWLLPFNVYDVAVFDAKHAVVIGIDTLAVIDLATGTVTPSNVFADDEKPESLVRAGDRMLVIGTRGETAMAWQLTLDPPRLSELPFPAAPPTTDTRFASRHGLASPDGTQIYTCTNDTQPVLRDATTLAIIRAYPEGGCFSPTFTDANHIVWRGDEGNDRSLDLTTGKTVTLDRKAATVRPGPGGLRLEVDDGVTKLFDGKRKIRSESSDNYVDEVHWNARYAVAEHFQALVIYPLDPEADVREVQLPELNALVALGDTYALAISGRSILRIDLSSGRMQKPSANLAMITAVAPRGGSVIASSDKVRVWRAGKVIGTTESATYIGVGSATGPVALVDYDKVDMWTPETNDRERVQELKYARSLARQGDTLVVVTFDRLFRGTTSSSLASWHVLRDEVSVAGIDITNDRLALEWKDASHVVDLKARTAWSFALDLDGDKSNCSTAGDVLFSSDGTTVLSTRRGIILVDTAKHAATELDIDDSAVSAALLTSGDIIAVGRKRITLWDPKTQTAIAWPTELAERPIAIGTSPDDTELAIAYADGAIWWVDIRGLRAHATPQEAKLVPMQLCDVKQVPYGSLVVE